MRPTLRLPMALAPCLLLIACGSDKSSAGGDVGAGASAGGGPGDGIVAPGEGEGEGETDAEGVGEGEGEGEEGEGAGEEEGYNPWDTEDDPWFDDTFLKDGIGPKERAVDNPRLTVVFTRPVAAGGGRELYMYRGEGPEGGEVQKIRLRDFGAPSNPYVSTDGNFVTFFESGGTAIGIADLRIADQSAATKRWITAGGGQQVGNPVLSGLGDILAYQLTEAGAKKLFLFDTVTEETTAVWENPGNTGFPQISDNADAVFFHSDSNAAQVHEVIRWTEANGPSNESQSATSQDQNPRLARNGEVACWRRSSAQTDLVGDVIVWADFIRRDITREFGVEIGLRNHFDCQPSSRGRHVVWRAHAENIRAHWLSKGAFWLYDLNAHEHYRLPEPSGVVANDFEKPYSPWRLSSDGRYVVFAAYADGSDTSDIFALELQTGMTYNLTQSPEQEGLGTPGVN